jgi:hypothetical protein
VPVVYDRRRADILFIAKRRRPYTWPQHRNLNILADSSSVMGQCTLATAADKLTEQRLLVGRSARRSNNCKVSLWYTSGQYIRSKEGVL